MWRRTRILLSFFIPILLLGMLAGLWICKYNQWDSLAFVTIIPTWMWAIPVLIVALIAALLIRNRLSYGVVLIWVATALLTSVETGGAIRSVTSRRHLSDTPLSGPVLRLVSVNCQEGSLRASHEIIPLEPDIVLMQEAPEKRHLEELTARLFGEEGSFVTANSNAILGRGKFLTFGKDENFPVIHARFRHHTGTILDLTNVKLNQSIPEFRIWNKAYREKFKAARVRNRKILREVVRDYEPGSGQPVRVVAGDFSTPPGDDIFRPLKKSGLRDAFSESGGWTGNTFPQKFPVFRIDQVWVSPEVHPVKLFTIPSPYSDHRILLCEFRVVEKSG